MIQLCCTTCRWKLVRERFGLPATFCGMLRYEDPDGDMISLNADDEMKEARRLCGDGKTLKMTLTAAQRSVQQEEHSVDACALSNVLEESIEANLCFEIGNLSLQRLLLLGVARLLLHVDHGLLLVFGCELLHHAVTMHC